MRGILAVGVSRLYHVTELSKMGLAMKHDAGFGVLTGNNIETHFFKAGSYIPVEVRFLDRDLQAIN